MGRFRHREVAGGVWHVFARGVAGRPVFVDRLDRARYLVLLATVVAQLRWRCLAYCLMDNHVHLLVETPEANLGVGARLLHRDYARELRWRHGLGGEVFEDGFGAVRVRDDAQLWAVAVYLAVNPVEAGLCGAPGAWGWSSYSATVGDTPAPPWLDVERLLWHFAGVGGDPRQRYRTYVADRLTRPRNA
jgi:putative transposase